MGDDLSSNTLPIGKATSSNHTTVNSHLSPRLSPCLCRCLCRRLSPRLSLCVALRSLMLSPLGRPKRNPKPQAALTQQLTNTPHSLPASPLPATHYPRLCPSSFSLCVALRSLMLSPHPSRRCHHTNTTSSDPTIKGNTKCYMKFASAPLTRVEHARGAIMMGVRSTNHPLLRLSQRLLNFRGRFHPQYRTSTPHPHPFHTLTHTYNIILCGVVTKSVYYYLKSALKVRPKVAV